MVTVTGIVDSPGTEVAQHPDGDLPSGALPPMQQAERSEPVVRCATNTPRVIGHRRTHLQRTPCPGRAARCRCETRGSRRAAHRSERRPPRPHYPSGCWMKRTVPAPRERFRGGAGSRPRRSGTADFWCSPRSPGPGWLGKGSPSGTRFSLVSPDKHATAYLREMCDRCR